MHGEAVPRTTGRQGRGESTQCIVMYVEVYMLNSQVKAGARGQKFRNSDTSAVRQQLVYLR
jgi:hypothetical protein